MEWLVFFKGLAAGFVVCAPMGPVGLLCLRCSLVDSPLEGFVSLLGASTADALYCLIAAFGVACMGNFLLSEQPLIIRSQASSSRPLVWRRASAA